MSSVVISGDTSGAITVLAPLVAGTNTLTLQAATATSAVNKLETAVTCAGQTSIDFTSIPSWVKKITVMLNGVSTSGTSSILVQLGDSGGIENTGYTGVAVRPGSSTNAYELSTAGFPLNESTTAASTYQSLATLALLDASTNTWVISGTTSTYVANNASFFSGGKSLSATLDRVRITTVNGTDTFDTTPSAGKINILYEG
jgi:hypothetical protein